MPKGVVNLTTPRWPTPLVLFLLMCVCLYSAANGDHMTQIVASICDRIPFFCAPEGFYEDQAHLTNAGYGSYAVGFSALRRLGPILFLLCIVYVSMAAVIGGVVVPKKPGRVALMAWVAFSLVFFWTLLYPDFYVAYDADFSGIHRPPMGSFVFGLNLFFAALSLFVAVGLTWTLAKSVIARSANAPGP